VILPMLVGGIPIGLLLAVVIFYPSRTLISIYQNRRDAMRARIQQFRNKDGSVE